MATTIELPSVRAVALALEPIRASVPPRPIESKEDIPSTGVWLLVMEDGEWTLYTQLDLPDDVQTDQNWFCGFTWIENNSKCRDEAASLLSAVRDDAYIHGFIDVERRHTEGCLKEAE